MKSERSSSGTVPEYRDANVMVPGYLGANGRVPEYLDEKERESSSGVGYHRNSRGRDAHGLGPSERTGAAQSGREEGDKVESKTAGFVTRAGRRVGARD